MKADKRTLIFNIFFGVLFGGCVLAFLVMALSDIIDNRQFRETGVIVDAIVVEIWQEEHFRRRTRTPYTIHRMTLVYESAGETIERVIQNPAGRYRIGDTVTIIHAQDNPRRIEIYNTKDNTSTLLLLALPVMLFGIYVLLTDKGRVTKFRIIK